MPRKPQTPATPPAEPAGGASSCDDVEAELSNAVQSIAKVEAKIEAVEEEIKEVKKGIQLKAKGEQNQEQAVYLDMNVQELKERLKALTEHLKALMRKDEQLHDEKARLGRQAMPSPDVPGFATMALLKGSSTKIAHLPLPVTYEQLCAMVEERFAEFEIEDFELRTDPKGNVLAAPWRLDRCNGGHINIHVTSKSKALNAFNVKDGIGYLSGDTLAPGNVQVQDDRFPAADIIRENQCPASQTTVRLALPFQTNGDVLQLLFTDLAARIHIGVDVEMQQERSRRELISPVLFAAAALAGDLHIAAEYAVRGTRAHGSIDWVYLYAKLAIIVCEAKWHENLHDHMGQLCAELKAVREDYVRNVLGKRKRDEPDALLARVRHIGIITNGTLWVFACYDESTGELFKSRSFTLPLSIHTDTTQLEDAALQIVARIVALLQGQKEAIDEMKAARAAKRQAL